MVDALKGAFTRGLRLGSDARLEPAYLVHTPDGRTFHRQPGTFEPELVQDERGDGAPTSPGSPPGAPGEARRQS